MKYFTVYTNQSYPTEIKLVPEGFSWIVFILGPFGLFLQKSWIHGLILLNLCFSLVIWCHPSIIIMGFIHFLIGCFAYHFQRTELKWSGWNLRTVVGAPNKKFAFLRLLDQEPNLKHTLSL